MTKDPERIREAVTLLVTTVRQQLPSVRSDSVPEVSSVFAFALLVRMANLIEGALTLCEQGCWDVSRVLGRAFKEAWLYCEYLAFAKNKAVETLFDEQEYADRRLAGGVARMEDLVGLARSHVDQPAHSTPRSPNVSDIANSLAAMREAEGMGGNVARGTYDMW
jgi:hypothetical protein